MLMNKYGKTSGILSGSVELSSTMRLQNEWSRAVLFATI